MIRRNSTHGGAGGELARDSSPAELPLTPSTHSSRNPGKNYCFLGCLHCSTSLQMGVLGGQQAHSTAKWFAPKCQLLASNQIWALAKSQIILYHGHWWLGRRGNGVLEGWREKVIPEISPWISGFLGMPLRSSPAVTEAQGLTIWSYYHLIWQKRILRLEIVTGSEWENPNLIPTTAGWGPD